MFLTEEDRAEFSGTFAIVSSFADPVQFCIRFEDVFNLMVEGFLNSDDGCFFDGVEDKAFALIPVSQSLVIGIVVANVEGHHFEVSSIYRRGNEEAFYDDNSDDGDENRHDPNKLHERDFLQTSRGFGLV